MNEEIQNKIKVTDAISTVIGRGTHIEGPVKIKNSARIDGHIQGSVTSDQDIIIGEGGIVDGKIVSKTAIIGGKVSGTVMATRQVILEENAELLGDIHTEQLKITEGAKFNGYCYMLSEGEKNKLALHTP